MNKEDDVNDENGENGQNGELGENSCTPRPAREPLITLRI